MFRGTYEHGLDPKGRTSLPAKFRDVLAGKYAGEGTLMITGSPDNSPCLRAYPMQEWRALEDKLADQDEFDPRFNVLLRMFVGRAHDLETDKLGRLLIPQGLRESVGLTKDVAFVGKLKHFEIWDAETFRAYTEKQMAEGGLPQAIRELKA